MSNFGQSSLGNTKAGARSEHEDSDRGKCFVPAQIRRDGKTTKRSLRGRKRRREKKREERKEKGRKKEKKSVSKILGLECAMVFNACMSMFINVTA